VALTKLSTPLALASDGNIKIESMNIAFLTCYPCIVNDEGNPKAKLMQWEVRNPQLSGLF